MKKTAVILMALGAAGCAGGAAAHDAAQREIQIMQVETPTPAEGAVPVEVARLDTAVGSSTHRVLRDSAGKTLFEYDLKVVSASPDGTYRLALKPSGKATFAASREVSLQAPQKVLVELMEDPATGRKIKDVYSSVVPETFGQHLMALHNQFYHWVHGQ
jgi:hypothetical protein